MSKHKRIDRLRYTPVIIAVFIALCASLVVTGKAQAQPVGWKQPYGGCVEGWQAPHSQGARECRQHGWTVRRHFVLDPYNRVAFMDLRPCRTEDGRGCYWDAERRGNHRGDSFVVSFNGERFYVGFAWL